MDTRTTPDLPSGATTRALPRTDAILEALARIEGRLDHMEARIADGGRSVGHVVAGVTDTVDRIVAQAQERGVDVDDRLRRVLALLERASEPASLRAIEHLIDLAVQAPALVATMVDTLDGIGARLAARGVDIDRAVHNLASAVELLTSDSVLELLRASAERAGALHTVISSQVLDPDVVGMVAAAGEAMRAAGDGEGVGAFGMLRGLGDADVRRTSGFLLRFARQFGRVLGRAAPAALPERARGAKDQQP